jgi:uncharacterized membrane protein
MVWTCLAGVLLGTSYAMKQALGLGLLLLLLLPLRQGQICQCLQQHRQQHRQQPNVQQQGQI